MLLLLFGDLDRLGRRRRRRRRPNERTRRLAAENSKKRTQHSCVVFGDRCELETSRGVFPMLCAPILA